MMRILAIDYNGLFAQRALVNNAMDLGKATAGVLAAVATHRQNFDRVALCVDSGKSFRASIWEGYKGNREDRGEVYREQLRSTLERLAKDGCSVFRAPEMEGGFAEADDVIGSLCEWARKAGHETMILSADKDMFQLVGEGVGLISLTSGSAYTSAEQVQAKMGVRPERIPDLLALMGDTSDNYKLCDGIGPKTATLLLDVCGHALAVCKPEHWDRLHEKEYLGASLGQKFRSTVTPQKIQAALKVATILCDLPIDFSPLESAPVFEQIAEVAPPVVAPPAERFQEAKAKEKPALALVKAEPATVERYRLNPFALEPKNESSAWQLANVLFESRLYPQYPNPQAILAVVMEGRTLGLPAPTALKNAYLVKGRVGWAARLLRGLCLKHSQVCDYFDIVETTAERATARVKRCGRPELIVTTTHADAQKRGLIQQPGFRNGKESEGNKWYTDPQSMCVADVERRGARLVFPDIVAGLWTPEELEAGADERGIELIEAAQP